MQGGAVGHSGVVQVRQLGAGDHNRDGEDNQADPRNERICPELHPGEADHATTSKDDRRELLSAMAPSRALLM